MLDSDSIVGLRLSRIKHTCLFCSIVLPVPLTQNSPHDFHSESLVDRKAPVSTHCLTLFCCIHTDDEYMPQGRSALLEQVAAQQGWRLRRQQQPALSPPVHACVALRSISEAYHTSPNEDTHEGSLSSSSVAAVETESWRLLMFDNNRILWY